MSSELSPLDREILAELKTAKLQVRYLLEHYPNTRNNDFYLQILWLRYFGGLKELPFISYGDVFKFSGKLETLRRMRQKIQNESGEFLPTDPTVLKRRLERSKSMRRVIREL